MSGNELQDAAISLFIHTYELVVIFLLQSNKFKMKKSIWHASDEPGRLKRFMHINTRRLFAFRVMIER